ncbi:hypothetical protein COCNU_scaffold008462G000050 [Cocos nucifera]|nr:hypothetical protein [Cocos nucifera]
MGRGFQAALDGDRKNLTITGKLVVSLERHRRIAIWVRWPSAEFLEGRTAGLGLSFSPPILHQDPAIAGFPVVATTISGQLRKVAIGRSLAGGGFEKFPAAGYGIFTIDREK